MQRMEEAIGVTDSSCLKLQVVAWWTPALEGHTKTPTLHPFSLSSSYILNTSIIYQILPVIRESTDIAVALCRAMPNETFPSLLWRIQITENILCKKRIHYSVCQPNCKKNIILPFKACTQLLHLAHSFSQVPTRFFNSISKPHPTLHHSPPLQQTFPHSFS